jgi:hypothetical protein
MIQLLFLITELVIPLLFLVIKLVIAILVWKWVKKYVPEKKNK